MGRSRMMGVLAMTCVIAACSGSRQDTAVGDSAADDSASMAAGGGPASELAGGDVRCYRSAVSVLLGPSRGGTSEGRAPGWIRLERVGADSGMAHLTDTGGAGLITPWQQAEGDSVHLAGFDDFLRVEMRLAATEARATGRAVATSDAAAERDSAGRPTDLRREWPVDAVRAPCDSMPVRAGG